jgi:hypothetical protein
MQLMLLETPREMDEGNGEIEGLYRTIITHYEMYLHMFCVTIYNY